MALKSLTRDQEAKSSVIFLNNFGLKLEDKEVDSKDTELKIFNSLNKQVGILYFDGDLIKIKAEGSFGTLCAEYKRIYYDVLFNNQTKKRYLDWVNNIRFNIFKNEHERIQGSFSLNASVDEDLKKRICVHIAPVKYLVDTKQIYNFSIIQYDDTFYSLIGDHKNSEEIEYSSKMLRHKRMTLNGSEEITIIEDGDQMIAQYKIFQGDKLVCLGDLANETIASDPKQKSEQMIVLMKQFNPAVERKMNEIKNIFSFEEIDLISNLINTVSPNDNIQKLLGIDIKPVVYQNDSTDITEVYFAAIEKKDKSKEYTKK